MRHANSSLPTPAKDAQPWTHVDDGLPPSGEVVLWADVDGDLHLGHLEGHRVFPVTYGRAASVRRPLGEHLFWAPIDGVVAWQAMAGASGPALNVELMWRDQAGNCHLGRLQGKRMYPVVYGDSAQVWRYCDELVSWGTIRRPTARLAG